MLLVYLEGTRQTWGAVVQSVSHVLSIVEGLMHEWIAILDEKQQGTMKEPLLASARRHATYPTLDSPTYYHSDVTYVAANRYDQGPMHNHCVQSTVSFTTARLRSFQLQLCICWLCKLPAQQVFLFLHLRPDFGTTRNHIVNAGNASFPAFYVSMHLALYGVISC